MILTRRVKENMEDTVVKGESKDIFVRFIRMLRKIGVNWAKSKLSESFQRVQSFSFSFKAMNICILQRLNSQNTKLSCHRANHAKMKRIVDPRVVSSYLPL